MRTLDSLQQQVVDRDVTEPQYFVYINLEVEHYWSTAREVEWDGHTWSPGYVRAGRITGDTAQLWATNHSYQHTQNAINGVYKGRAVEIWHAYETTLQPYWAEGYAAEGYVGAGRALPAPLLVFSGVVDIAAPEDGPWLHIQARQPRLGRFPRRRWRPPFANHIPGEGYTFEFDGTLLVVEARNNG